MKRHEATAPHRSPATSPHDHETLLLIAVDRGVERVACACEAAAVAGVRRGMTVAHARSLLAGQRVRVAPHKPEDVARALDRMVQWAFRFSPVVTADSPEGLLLDISGCAHLYAGEERLAKSIVSSLEQWRFPARACVGPTAAVSRAVARYSAERITIIPDHAAGDELRFLPVSALGVEPAIRDALAEIGVVNIDQLLNLPREDLAPRFGATLLRRMDHALGLAHELIEPVRCIEPVEFKRTFEGAITSQEAIFLTVEQLLRNMIAHLARDESGVCRMTLTFHRIEERHDGRPAGPNQKSPAFQHSSDAIDLSLSFPSRDFRHLWSLLRPRLERVHLGYGVEEIVLRALQSQRLSHTQMELWPDAASPTHADDHAGLGQWLDQVIERLGRHAVVEMNPAERYLPEQAFAPTVVQQAGAPEHHAKKSVYPATRPSKLFSPPHHARVIALVPDGPPAWVQWQGREEHVACGYGPERICGPWWNGQSHEGAEGRDYFVIQTESGQWLWVFREGATAEWFVHGEWS